MSSGPQTTTVAHVVENLEVGGLERVVVNLMTRTDPSRFRPVLVCLGNGGALADEVEEGGYPTHRLHKRAGLDYRMLPRMTRLLRREGARVVHCHNFSPLVYGAVGARLARAAGVVYTAHGAVTASRRKQRLFQRLGLVDEFVFVSDDARRVALEGGAVYARGTRTIANGIEVERYARAEARAPTREGLGIAPDAPVVGTVGRLTRAKDHPNLLRAFRRVLDERPAARLLIVGDGELRDETKARARDLGVEGAVVFTGSRSDVPELLSTMDLFVLSSYTEGLAMTLLEAMAAGLAIVATSVGGNTEAVVDGETGRIVPPRDSEALARAMGSVLDDRSGAARMGQAGRERVERHFSTENMVAAYEVLYERILNRGGRARASGGRE